MPPGLKQQKISYTLHSKKRFNRLGTFLNTTNSAQEINLKIHIQQTLLRDLKQIALKIQENSNVQSLHLHIHLQGYNSPSTAQKPLSKAANFFLYFYNKPVSLKTCEIICLMLSNKPRLKILSVNANIVFNESHLNAIKTILASVPIEQLSFKMNFNENLIYKVGSPVPIRHLKSIEIKKCLQPYPILLLVQTATVLEKLHFHDFDIDEDSAELITRIISNNQSGLRSVTITSIVNQIAIKNKILRSLVKLKNLTELDLYFTSKAASEANANIWTEEQLGLIYDILKANPQLTILNLSQAKGITDNLRMILRPLNQHKTIKTLIVNNCNLSETDYKNLYLFLLNNPQVTHLEIDQVINASGFGSYHFKYLLKFISNNQIHLKKLSYNHIISLTADEDEQLIKALEKNHRLKELTIKPLSGYAEKAIKETLQEHHSRPHNAI